MVITKVGQLRSFTDEKQASKFRDEIQAIINKHSSDSIKSIAREMGVHVS